jgi:hypothetical protein
MLGLKTPMAAASDRGTQVALIFALTAERLTLFYEHAQWLTDPDPFVWTDFLLR